MLRIIAGLLWTATLTACFFLVAFSGLADGVQSSPHSRLPHSARHAMGRDIIEKTGNITAVRRQLGHKNAAYSMQYARITSEELAEVLNDR